MYGNLNFACLKLLRLLQDGDVECNPGTRNFANAKVIQGSFHQGPVKFVGQLLNVLLYGRQRIWIIFYIKGDQLCTLPCV